MLIRLSKVVQYHRSVGSATAEDIVRLLELLQAFDVSIATKDKVKQDLGAEQALIRVIRRSSIVQALSIS